MNTEHKAVAIIPARGGSKRIPHKNIREFCGKPLIAYSIEAALHSNLFSHVLVSTDDKEIASVASRFGAEVPFVRPENLSGDFTSTDDVVVHALNCIPKPLPAFACCIYATAPFISSDDLREGFRIIISSNATTAISITTFPYCIHRALKINQAGRIKMFSPENYTKRSQDFEEAWHDAGQFYWLKTDKYLIEKKLFSSNAVPIPLLRKRVQDIDTLEDWEQAEALFLIQQNSGK